MPTVSTLSAVLAKVLVPSITSYFEENTFRFWFPNLKLRLVMYKPLSSICSFVHMITHLVAFYCSVYFNELSRKTMISIASLPPYKDQTPPQTPSLVAAGLSVDLCFVALLKKYLKVRSCLSVIWCLEQSWWTNFHKIYTHYFHWNRNIKWYLLTILMKQSSKFLKWF